VSRVQVWDSSGNPVADRGSQYDGLHNYMRRGMGDVQVDPVPVFWMRATRYRLIDFEHDQRLADVRC